LDSACPCFCCSFTYCPWGLSFSSVLGTESAGIPIFKVDNMPSLCPSCVSPLALSSNKLGYMRLSVHLPNPIMSKLHSKCRVAGLSSFQHRNFSNLCNPPIFSRSKFIYTSFCWLTFFIWKFSSNWTCSCGTCKVCKF